MKNNNIDRRVRVRFAPSPTGPLHIGGARTALYNYLFARQNGGDMIIRIEDTDSHRFVPGAEDYIIEALHWLGIEIDEGIGTTPEGPHAPYRQSERRDIYRNYVGQLLSEGKAYYAFDTPEELEKHRAEIPNFQYDAQNRLSLRNSLSLTEEEVKKLIADGTQYVVRLKIEPDVDITVNDIIRGEVVINSSVLDDKVLYKSADDLPTYHLANVVDDHLMEISHVIRGEEWLPSSPLHVLLYRAFGWEDTMPQFAHLPLLLKPEGNGKLSKRDGDRLGFPVFPLLWTDPVTQAISSGYRESGYLPNAVVNFLALLGWNSGTDQEIFSMKELIDSFDLKKCSKSGAKFDYEKGKWFNHKYIQELSGKEIVLLSKAHIERAYLPYDEDRLAAATEIIKDRITLLSDLPALISFFFVAPISYDESAIKKRWKEDTPVQLQEVRSFLASITDWKSAHLEDTLKSFIAEKGFNLGGIMNPLRLSLVGALQGPHLFDILEFIGKNETLARIEKAIDTIGSLKQ